jgi:hypothetical protein
MGLMADSIPRCMSTALIQKLHALAERRCANLTDMQSSGRWTRHYSREELSARIQDASRLSQQWHDMLETAQASDNDMPPVAADLRFAQPAAEPELSALGPMRASMLALRRPAAAPDRERIFRRVSAG